MGWKGWQTFLTHAVSLTCRAPRAGPKRGEREIVSGARGLERMHLNSVYNQKLNKKRKQKKIKTYFPCHGSTLDLKIETT